MYASSLVVIKEDIGFIHVIKELPIYCTVAIMISQPSKRLGEYFIFWLLDSDIGIKTKSVIVYRLLYPV